MSDNILIEIEFPEISPPTDRLRFWISRVPNVGDHVRLEQRAWRIAGVTWNLRAGGNLRGEPEALVTLVRPTRMRIRQDEGRVEGFGQG